MRPLPSYHVHQPNTWEKSTHFAVWNLLSEANDWLGRNIYFFLFFFYFLNFGVIFYFIIYFFLSSRIPPHFSKIASISIHPIPTPLAIFTILFQPIQSIVEIIVCLAPNTIIYEDNFKLAVRTQRSHSLSCWTPFIESIYTVNEISVV